MGRATGHRMLLSSTMYYCVLFDMRPAHAWFYCSCFSHSPYSYLRYEYDPPSSESERAREPRDTRHSPLSLESCDSIQCGGGLWLFYLCGAAARARARRDADGNGEAQPAPRMRMARGGARARAARGAQSPQPAV